MGTGDKTRDDRRTGAGFCLYYYTFGLYVTIIGLYTGQAGD